MLLPGFLQLVRVGGTEVGATSGCSNPYAPAGI